MKPLAFDLYCGLGGWAEGLIAEGWDVIGFDIEQHVYGDHRYPAQLVLQDVMTLCGTQLRGADLIVASPPCQQYSYRAMPWKRAKELPPPCNRLFKVCFQLQLEASAAAGRDIPMIVENVKGAQKWVGRARARYGSYYLWGDVPALMPRPVRGYKSSGINCSDREKRGQDFTRVAGNQAIKNSGGSWPSPMRVGRAGSTKRKFASALIAKIPFELATYIARTFKPREKSLKSVGKS